jgi:O-antigen/teichoic acid export membrane protein
MLPPRDTAAAPSTTGEAEGSPFDAAAATTGASVARGGTWNVAAKAIPQVYLVVISIAAARFLGAEAFGRQSFIAFVAIATTMFLTAGLPHALARYVGYALGRGEGGAARALFALSLRIEFPAAALGTVILATIGLAGAEPRAAWLLAAAVTGIGVVQRVPSALLVGVQRWREASVAGLVVGGLGVAATVLVLWAGGGISGMFAVEAAVAAVTLVWIGVFARRAVGVLRGGSASVGAFRPEMLRFAGLSSIEVLLTFVVWRRSELLFLDAFSSDAQIAFYSVSFAAVTALVLFPEAIGGVLLPAVATLHGAGAHERIRAGYGRALRLLLLLSLPVTAGAAALGPPLLRLVYGDDFEPAGEVLLVLVAPVPLISLISLANVLVLALGRLRVLLVAGGVATVVDIALAFILIPRYDAIGAAITNVSAQLTAGLPVLVAASRMVGGVRWEPRAMLRAVVVSAAGGIAAAACVVLLGDLGGVMIGLPLGFLVAAALAVVLGVLPADDARWVEEAAGRRARGLIARTAHAVALPERKA